MATKAINAEKGLHNIVPGVDDEPEMDIKNIIRYASEVATLLGVLSYVILQQGDEIKNQGFAAFTKQLVRNKKIRIL